jgi:hypothetical protein
MFGGDAAYREIYVGGSLDERNWNVRRREVGSDVSDAGRQGRQAGLAEEVSVVNQGSLFEVEASLRAAIVSPCGKYRNSLLRTWEDGPILYWVMLNPSTADADHDDQTTHKVMGFARCNGFGSIMIENLVPYRSTDPKRLVGMTDLDLLGNREFANEPFRRIPKDAKVVCGWGGFPYKHNHLGRRMIDVMKMLDRPLLCVKQSLGRPWHPLYVPYGPLQVWNPMEL